MRLSPANLKLLLHIYAIYEPFLDTGNPVLTDWITFGIIEKNHGDEGGCQFKTTERGNMWVEMILSTPLPVSRWVDPREKP